jgi:hypothetical protein
MIPHERSLVKKLEGKPFALLGINSDRDRDELKKKLKDENISWRSWWDGGSTSGPTAKAWNVHGWPTVYVLDEKGIIRAKHVADKSMEMAVEKLLADLEKGKKQ